MEKLHHSGLETTGDLSIERVEKMFTSSWIPWFSCLRPSPSRPQCVTTLVHVEMMENHALDNEVGLAGSWAWCAE